MEVKRGVSTLILSFLFALIILTIFVFTSLQMLSSTFYRSIGFKNAIRYIQSSETSNIAVVYSVNSVTLINLGSRDIPLDGIVIYDVTGPKTLEPETLCGGNILRTGSQLSCNPSYKYIAIITKDGAIIYPQARLAKYVNTNSTVVIPISFSIKTPDELGKLFDVDESIIRKPYTRNFSIDIRGVKSDKLLLLPPGQGGEFYNAIVSTDNNGMRFGVVYIGYDPSWIIERSKGLETPPRFTIIINGPGFPGERITFGTREITLSGNGFRLLINNFTGTIKILKGSNVIACSSTNADSCTGVKLSALGPWYYGSTETSLNLRLYLDGIASYAAYFQRQASQNSPSGETSYYPYLFVGDFDGNNLIDIVFITEDAYYGSSDRKNDFYGNDDLNDWSTIPLVLKLNNIGRALGSSDGSIDGSIYSGVMLYINIFFHDNSYPDINQLVDNDRTDWILRILVIDESGNEYIVREYRYQEICNYHKTLIEDFEKDNYYVKISQTVYVPMPGPGKYWIAIAFQDPYGSGNTNDADVTAGIEIIAAVPFSR